MDKYQSMTALPESLERALLEVPMPALLKACGWAGAGTAYTCVRYLAKVKTENQLWALAKSEFTEEDLEKLAQEQARLMKRPAPDVLPPAWMFHSKNDPANSEHKTEAPAEPKPAKPHKEKAAAEPVVSRTATVKRMLGGKLNDATVVVQAEGKTKLAQGSARRRLMEHLKVAGGELTIGELTVKVGQPAKPLVGKLLEVGWVTIKEAK
jgi:hypothetical protein